MWAGGKRAQLVRELERLAVFFSFSRKIIYIGCAQMVEGNCKREKKPSKPTRSKRSNK